jgi:hypothetical protein
MKKRILLLLSVVALMVVMMMAASAMPAFADRPAFVGELVCERGDDGHGIPQGGPHEGTNPVPFCVE